MAARFSFRPDALAASMARTLTLRSAPDTLLIQWAQSQLAQIEFLVRDGPDFELSPFISSLADAERSGFAGRVGAGMTDLLMNTLGYVWRDNAICLSSTLDPHADFVYAGGAASGHGVVLAEAHGSFAQNVSANRIAAAARDKYLRQVRPHIACFSIHGQVVHGYAVAFGSNPASLDTYLHVAETQSPKRKPSDPIGADPIGTEGLVPTSLALASHRSNFLLMGATQVVRWIDWVRGIGERPAEDSVTTFFVTEIAGRRFLVAAEQFFPYFHSQLMFEEFMFPSLPHYWHEFDHWRRRLRSGRANIFGMDEWAAKAFLAALTAMIGGGRDQVRSTLDLPVIEPSGLSLDSVRASLSEDERYPVAQFRDGLALLGRFPRSQRPDLRFWSAERGMF